MDAKIIIYKLKLPALFFFLLLPVFLSCDDKVEAPGFSYKTILDREFSSNIGRSIPVASEKAIETDGDISSDGKYMYYTSNRENGNFDIYLRDLKDITTARLTQHAAKDNEPAISPDGKHLVFVSNRENPEGDIYLMKIDPEAILKRARLSVAETKPLDADAKNLTQVSGSNAGFIRNSSPAWSPDGKKIAFMSRRGGSENIWIMNKDGGGLTQFTRDGGLYPRYSFDGTKIIFISYRDKNSLGDIYIKDVNSGEEIHVAAEAGIKLYPSFLKSNDAIIYTLIPRDTNGDKIPSLQDDSVIMYYNIRTKFSYPITLPSQNSFNAKWFMPPWVLKSSYEGVILYSDIRSGNIDVNMIPGYGIIPKRTGARQQYNSAIQYDEEDDDTERYFLALKRVYYFFGDKKDNDSKIYTARAMSLLWKEYAKNKNKKGLEETETIFQTLIPDNLYAKAQYESIKAGGGNGISVIKNIIAQAMSQKDNAAFLPYLKEDLANMYLQKGDKTEAIKIFSEIKAEYPNYSEIASVHMEYALLSEKSAAASLSDSAIYTIQKGRPAQRFQMYNHIISLFDREKNARRKLALLKSMAETYKENKEVKVLALYIMGLIQKNLNQSQEAAVSLEEAVAISSPNDILYYRSHLLLAEIYRGDNLLEVKHLALAINNYKRYFSDNSYRNKVRWLIDFYEEIGAQYVKLAKLQEAISIYDQYRNLIKYIYTYKFFPEIYSIYGPRAHVLYVDAVHLLKKQNGTAELEKEYSADLYKARIGSDKAYIYGLAYIFALKALEQDGDEAMFNAFSQSIENIDWALFIDDSFIDPYILKSWIYQYADLKRSEANAAQERIIDRYFPEHLWEKNIAILERALLSNDEELYPEHSGNIHLNLANNYFLLVNYPRALAHYELARKYKKKFDSKISQSLFYFHMAYCYWQNDDIDKAKAEIRNADFLYKSFANERNMENYAWQFYTIYKYYALFYRAEGKYEEAIDEYRKILSFAAKYNIKIDRARYFQEIAYCYQELGQYGLAIDSLNTAERLLANYPNDEVTYKNNIKWINFFGFQFHVLSVHVWDLGPDMVVVGNNKIFYSLDTRSKKLLNLSMFENIQLKRSDYAGAIKYLEKKAELLKGRNNSVDRETLIITYNNLGYYNAMISAYDKAVSYFNKTWDTAKEYGFLEGSFAAIMNLSNLYAHILERNPESLKNAQAEINTLSERILKYRESYETDIYNRGLQTLKADAKKQNRTVADEEIAKLKRETTELAKDVYYKIDISLGVLDYYKAELKRVAFKVDSSKDAYSLYNENRELYNMYQETLKRFIETHSVAEARKDRMLSTKLLLNIGNCYAATGDFDNAYVAFLDAKEAALEIKFRPLMFSSSAALGIFLKNHGGKVAGRDAASQAQANLRQAISYVREAPLLYAALSSRVENVYDAMLEIHAAGNRWADAFESDEERTAFNRVALIHSGAAGFYSSQHRRIYEGYADLTRELQGFYVSAQELAVSGYGDSSPEMAAALRNIEGGRKRLLDYAERTAAEEPLLASYMLVRASPLSSAAGAHVIRFIMANNSLCVISMKGGRVEHLAEPDIQKAVEKLASEKQVYIAFNKFFVGILKDQPKFLSEIKATLITSIDQASDKRVQAVNTLYCVGPADKESFPMFSIVTGSGKEDPAGYDVIADNLSAPLFTPEFLFKTRLNPALLITAASGNNFETIFKTVEAARYAGASAVIISLAPQETKIVSLVKSLENGSAAAMGREPILVFGEPLDITGKSEYDNALAYERYRHKLTNGLLTDAMIELNRWYKTEKANPETVMRYAAAKFNILLLQRDLNGAEAFVDGNELSGLSDTQRAVYKIYLNFYKGEVNTALSLMGSEKELASCAEYHAFTALAEIASKGDSANARQSIRKYFDTAKQSENFGNCIPLDKMALLIASYLNLAGANAAAVLMETPVLSDDRDTAMALSNSEKVSFSGSAAQKASEMKKLCNAHKSDIEISRVMPAIRDISGGNAFIALILLVTKATTSSLDVFYSELLNFDGFEDIRSRSYWTDRLILDLKLAAYLSSRKNYDEAWKIIESLNKFTENRGINSFRKEALTEGAAVLSALKRFPEAYSMAAEAASLIAEDDRTYMPVQFTLLDAETLSTTPDAAKPRIERLLGGTNLTDADRFTIRFFQARVELKRISSIKNPAADDGKLFESFYFDALDMADKNPSLLSEITLRPLVEEIADAYISYRMKTGDKTGALNYAEVKKHLLARIDFSAGFPLRVHTAAALQDLQDNPAIELSSFMRDAAPERAAQKLDDTSYICYIIRNSGDMFVWLLGNKTAHSVILEGAARQFERLIAEYDKAAASTADTQNIASAMSKVFSPLDNYLGKAKNIYFITDEFTEKIPFEILYGENGLFFVSSLTAVHKKISEPAGVFTIGSDKSAVSAAISESGIRVSDKNTRDSIAHFFERGSAAKTAASYYQQLKSGGAVYVHSLFIDRAGFAVYSSANGVSFCIINDALLQEGAPYFINIFYEEIAKGTPAKEAFGKARVFYKGRLNYRHPAYWSFIRMYLNGL
ncbi:MAG: tetratricopeptide repeat protein [Leptospirales bacterium]|nr:tetratricopeptide repeat protein [Leptospirales bacterium]